MAVVPERRARDLSWVVWASTIGAVLGPLGVRYILVPERVGPTSGRVVPAPSGVVDTLADQLDLVRLETRDGLALYEVVPWQPVRSVVATTPGGIRTPPLAARNPAGTVQLLGPRDGAWRAHGADGALDQRKAGQQRMLDGRRLGDRTVFRELLLNGARGRHGPLL